MAKITLNGFDEYALKLDRLGVKSEEVCRKAVYKGAGILADSVANGIDSLQAVNDAENLKAYRSDEKYHLSKTQKRCLKESLGIAKFETDNGNVQTSVGFNGYNDIKTKKYPNGQPNQLIARVIESGSSYMDKTPFVRPAVNKVRKKAQEAMEEVIDEEFRQIMEG